MMLHSGSDYYFESSKGVTIVSRDIGISWTVNLKNCRKPVTSE